jgi:hypothetical protein
MIGRGTKRWSREFAVVAMDGEWGAGGLSKMLRNIRSIGARMGSDRLSGTLSKILTESQNQLSRPSDVQYILHETLK